MCLKQLHLKGHITITGVCDPEDNTLEKKLQQLPEGTKAYDSYDELLNSGIDAIVLCDYFHTHCKFAIQALEKGIAVFSETTAAPSLGECVDLVEAVERTGGKYMLMANCPYFKALQYAKKKMADVQYGDLIYADAEYVHPIAPELQKVPDFENLHWRETLPHTYYNMHSLGPLMYVTESMPKKVMAKGIIYQHKTRPTNVPKAFIITEMDNGATFNTTGCVGVGTVSKWYRFAFENGTMETERLEETPETLIYSSIDHDSYEKHTPSWLTSGAISEEERKEFGALIDGAGHGGIDFVLCLEMLRYLKDEIEPFFDVYRSVALSANGILAWYSMLDGGKEYEIPDFKNPAEREKVRGDYRKPFGKTLDDLTLPCRIEKDGE